jgi:competence protein ComEC
MDKFHEHSVKSDVKFIGKILVDSKPKLIDDNVFFVGKLENELKVNVRLKKCNYCEELSYGEYIYTEGVIKPISSTRNFAGFNNETYLIDNHFIGSLITNKITNLEHSKSYFYKLNAFRNSLIELYSSYSDHITVGFMLALVVGDRDTLSDEIQILFQKFGLVHLIAISGMQVHILTFGLYKLFIRCGITKERTQVFLLILQPMICILTGMSSSVIRSTFTTGLYLFTKISKLKFLNIDILATSFVILLLFEPLNLLDIGFQLSYFNSLALLLSVKFLNGKEYFKTIFNASIICQLVSFPILINNFNGISLLSIPLNLICIPLINIVIFPISLFLIVCLPIVSNYYSYKILLVPSDNILKKLMSILSNLDKYNIELLFPTINLMLIIIETILIILIFYYFEQGEKLKYKIVSYLTIIVLVGHIFQPYLDSKYSITMLDVGQGDCILIKTSYTRETIVVDTGGNFLAKNSKFMVNSIIIPTLKSQGVSQIDYLIITHGDFDHAGNVNEVLKQVKVKNILFGLKKSLTSLEKGVINFAKQNKIKIHSINQLHKLKLANGLIEFLTPYSDTLEGNSSSITFILSCYNYKFLFTGDLENEGEEWLLKNYNFPEIDVLKVSHHGSKGATSDKFLQEIRPKLALISVGKNNLYKHPHKEVLQRLESINSNVYRTDLSGAIKLVISEKSVTILTARP